MFQQKIANGRFTLAWAILIALLAWLFHYVSLVIQSPYSPPSREGLASALSSAERGMGLGFLTSILAVYFIAELNNAFALLRISSRMLSSTLIILLAAAPMLHTLQMAHLLLICNILAYFNLFATYQRPAATTHTFLIYFLLATAALAFPQLIITLPVWWVSQFILQSLNFRSWIASIIGIVTPSWLIATIAYSTDQLPKLLAHLNDGWQPQPLHFNTWTIAHYAIVTLSLAIFIIATIDLILKAHLDKTRTRHFYQVIIVNAIATFILLILYPQHIQLILPLCLIHTAMTGGHFVALSYGKLQNIIVILFLILLLLLPLLSFTQDPPPFG